MCLLKKNSNETWTELSIYYTLLKDMCDDDAKIIFLILIQS